MRFKDETLSERLVEISAMFLGAMTGVFAWELSREIFATVVRKSPENRDR